MGREKCQFQGKFCTLEDKEGSLMSFHSVFSLPQLVPEGSANCSQKRPPVQPAGTSGHLHGKMLLMQGCAGTGRASGMAGRFHLVEKGIV